MWRNGGSRRSVRKEPNSEAPTSEEAKPEASEKPTPWGLGGAAKGQVVLRS